MLNDVFTKLVGVPPPRPLPRRFSTEAYDIAEQLKLPTN